MTDLGEIVPSSGEPAERIGPPFAWDGVVLLVLGAAIAIGGTVWGTVWGMWTSFERIERDPVPTPEELAAGVGVDVATESMIAGGVVGLVGLALIALSAWSRSRLRSGGGPAHLDERGS
jgi:cell division protein FtsX